MSGGTRNCTRTLVRQCLSPCCHEEPKQGGASSGRGTLSHRLALLRSRSCTGSLCVCTRVNACVCACVCPFSLIFLSTPRASQSAWLTAVSVNVSESPSTSGPPCLKPRCPLTSLPLEHPGEKLPTAGASVPAQWTGPSSWLEALDTCPFPKELKFVWASPENAGCCLHCQPGGAGPQFWECDSAGGARVFKNWRVGRVQGRGGS